MIPAATGAAVMVSQVRQDPPGGLPSGVLRTNMAMGEETGRFDVQLLTDVFTDLDQITATVTADTGFRFVVMLNAGQFRRQGIPSGVARSFGGR